MESDVNRDDIVTGPHSAEKQEMAIAMRRAPTHAEAKLWRHVRANQVAGFHFRRQQVIDGFIADFYCHAAALVIEVDGPIHDSQSERDAQRTAALQVRGLAVVRFTNEDVETRLSYVLARIARAARVRSALFKEVQD